MPTEKQLADKARAKARAEFAREQSDDWRRYATEREDTAQQVIERHRREHECLLKLLADARKTIAELEDKAKPEAQQPKGLTTERLRQMHHEDEFGLFCDFDEFEQIARAVEQEHSIGASGEKQG